MTTGKPQGPCICSVHTHTTLCDGTGTPEEMAQAACRAGVKYYGFSAHSHTPIPSDQGHTLPVDMAAYRERVLALREEYDGRMELLLGLEWDSFADVEPDGFDYWIGSVHYQRGPDGSYYGMDWDKGQFARCRDKMYGGDALAVTEGYFLEVAKVAAKNPTILGHIDLITKLNAKGDLFDETAPRYRNAALQALHAANPHETLLEVNTGAMARGYRDMPYPALFLLQEWKSMGGQVILTADAHSPDAIQYAYGQAADVAQAAGFTRSAVLTLDGVKETELCIRP